VSTQPPQVNSSNDRPELRGATDNPRLNAGMLERHAVQFVRAADLYAADDRHHEWMPTYFLLGRGVELSLKALLLRVPPGVSTKDLKGLGHNLMAALARAELVSPATFELLDRQDRQALELLSTHYATHMLTYPEQGLYSLPNPAVMRRPVDKILHAVHLQIWGRERYHLDCDRGTAGLVAPRDVWGLE
jgi:hypothetical protein